MSSSVRLSQEDTFDEVSRAALGEALGAREGWPDHTCSRCGHVMTGDPS